MKGTNDLRIAADASCYQKIIIRESKRNNAVYRQEALSSLGDFAEWRKDHDMYPQVLEITEPVIRDWSDEADNMDIDSTSGGPSSKSM